MNKTIDEEKIRRKKEAQREIIITMDTVKNSKSRDVLLELQLPYLISATPPSGFAWTIKKVIG